MNATPEHVQQHYGRGRILESILDGLRLAGKSPDALRLEDLAPVDEFHIRGRESTIELARRAPFAAGEEVLDVGSGLGGSARYLAAEYGCRVTGVDLTAEYVDAANALSAMVKLDYATRFLQGSALELPFEDGRFDAVWTEHVQMNVADKQAFYGELARVLRPGGRLLFHDIFLGTGDPLRYPVPWSDDGAISFLATPAAVAETLDRAGLAVHQWDDRTGAALEWFVAALERIKAAGPPPLGLHLLMGPDARTKFENLVDNLRGGRVVAIQAVAARP